MNNSWLQYNTSSNRFKQTYLQGFLDVSGNTIVRNGSLNVKNGKILIPNGDISMNGNIVCSGTIELGATAGSGYKMVINGNTRVKNSILVDNDASVMSSLGVGKAANDSYPLDVSGATRLSSDLTVGGSATIGSITTGSSRFNGSVGIGADIDPTYALYTNGQFRSTGLSIFDQAIAVGSEIDVEAGELQSSTLFVKVPITSTATNDVIMNVPNNLYTSTDDANRAQVNNLEIDTKNRVIKPYRNYEGALVNDAADGWDLGAPGAYSFDHVYGRSLEVSKNVGIGKDSDAAYAIDVSGASRISSNLTVGGAATLASLENVTGTSKFSGHVGFGKMADGAHAVDISGSTRVGGSAFVDDSLIIGQSEPSTAALHVKVPYNLDISNSVVFEVPNVIYKSTSSANPSQTNYLEIDTKTRSIKPYAKAGDTLLNSAETGWDLGGPGANRFNTIYGRDLQISTNTIKIEDDSGNQISMGFNATTGSVNYTVTTISGEVFVIKGVQTQKITSGAGKIDPSMLEFTGLSFGDTFITNNTYSFNSAFTYNLGTTTYTGNGTEFSTSSAAQSLNSFVTGTNLTTLLARIVSGTSVVIKVGATDGRTAHLEGIDVEGSLVSLSNKIISVHKQGATIKWTLWNSDAYQNSAGNFLHYIELKNINMASGTYFVAKTAGTLTYNINDTHYMSSGDLTPENGDLYLYIERGPGNNWTKIPVSLPQSGSIQTQHLANSAVTTAKLANNSVTGDKLAGGSISGTKITDNSITGAKIADSNVTSAKIAAGAITGAKIATGGINSAELIANGIITGNKLVAGSVTESALGDAAVVTAKLADSGVTTVKIADSAVTAEKVMDGTLTSSKFATDSITSVKIVGGAVTNAKLADNSISTEKIMDGAVTASKLAAGVVTGNLLDASSVTMDKIATGAISTEKIAGLSVVTGKIAALAVTSAKMADGSVTDAKLATDSVISEKISTGAITTAKLATNSVSEEKIVDGAVTGTKIAPNSITSTHFNTASVTTAKIDAMAVTTAKINDYAVTTNKIGNLAVGTEQINDLAITGAKIAAGSITTDKIAAGVSLMGPTGATGPRGDTGIAGPTGAVGPAGTAASTSTTSDITSNSLTITSSKSGHSDTVITGNINQARFGQGATISRNNNVMIIMNSYNTLFIYRKNISTLLWVLETSISVGSGYIYPAISGDGNTIVVSNGTTASKKYTYTVSWSAAVTLTGANAFGQYVLINNDASLIFFFNRTSPPYKIYKASDGSITNVGVNANSSFVDIAFSGVYSASISDDGTTVVISDFFKNYTNNDFGWSRRGVILVITYNNNAWTTNYIIGTTLDINLGRNTCVSGDGKIIATSSGFQEGSDGYTYPVQYNLNGIYLTGYDEITIYVSDTYGNWSIQSKIPRISNQLSGTWGSKLVMNTIGDTLVVGCWASLGINTQYTAFMRNESAIIGNMIYTHVYKRVGSNWTLYTTYMTDVYRHNLMYTTSRYGASISIDSSGNSVVVSEDNYYLKPNTTNCNNVGRIHIYDLNNATALNVSGGIRIKDNICTNRDIIADGSCLSNKVYTNMCSVMDTLAIGGTALYGLYDENSLYNTESYSLLVRCPSGGPSGGGLTSNNINTHCRVRFDGSLHIYSPGYGYTYTPGGLLINLEATTGTVSSIKVNSSTDMNVGRSIHINSNLNSTNAYINNITNINTGIVLGNLNVANISRDTQYLSRSKLIVGNTANDWDLGSAYSNPVCLSENGNVMLTSAPIASILYIYRRDVTTLMWGTATTILKSCRYISLSKDGNVIATSNGTTIWIYRWSGTAWVLQTQTITNSTYAGNFVKQDMNLNYDGSKILVGSYTSDSVLGLNIYNTVTGSIIVPISLTGKGFVVGVGYSASRIADWNITFKSKFSSDGSTVIVSNSATTGKVLIYDINYSTSVITLNTTFTGSVSTDFFGKNLAINSTGTVIAFCAGSFTEYNNATSKARVLLYKRSVGGSEWTLDKTFYDTDANGLTTPGFGSTVCLDDIGNNVFIGVNDESVGWRGLTSVPGFVCVSKYMDNNWQSFKYITESLKYNTFGGYLATNSDGTSLIVNSFCDMSDYNTANNNNAPYKGAIYVYDAYGSKSLDIKSSNSIILSTGNSPISRLTIAPTGAIGIGTAPVVGTALTISGSVTATGSITGSSDDRLKENEMLITNATDTIMKLRPEIYDKKPYFTSSDTSTWHKESGLIAQEVWYGAPELRHLVKLGQFVSDFKKEMNPLPSLEITRYIDASGNDVTDASGNDVTDASGNDVTDASGNKTVVDIIPMSNTIDVPIYKEIDPSKIIDISLNDDIRNDPDYAALGWGVTPASVNYIGLIPYLVKSIQELNTKIIEQETTISELKSKL